MGSWNATCAISQLPILPGEKVRFLMLTQHPNPSRNEACHSTEFWQPRAIPIHAKYNDYGSIEKYDPNDYTIKMWWDQFQKDLIEIPIGENTCHDVPTSKNMSFDKFLTALWEGRIQVTYSSIKFDRNSKMTSGHFELPVYQAMIRDDVYKSILKIMATPKLIDETVEEIRDILKKAIADSQQDKIKKILILHNISQLFDEYYFHLPFLSPKRNLIKWNSPFNTAEGCFSGNPSNTIQYLIENNIDLDSKETLYILRELLEFGAVSSFMENFRKTWHPQCGAGSQDQNWDEYKTYHTAIIKIIDKKLELESEE